MNETVMQKDVDVVENVEQPSVKRITLNDPWKWLSLGWQDMRSALGFSLPYGMVFVVVSYLLIWGMFDGGFFFMIPLLAAGFFLSAPILGIGLYGISRSLEDHNKVEFCQIKKSWLSNPVHISAIGIILMLIMLFWMLSSIIVFVLFFDSPTLNWDQFFTEVFLSGENNLFLFMGVFFGAAIALFTFTISVITVPLLMDRQIDFMTAINVSVDAVKTNPKELMLWAYLIVMLVCISFMTYFVGLLITMPVIGHATWHAYRDLVESDNASAVEKPLMNNS